MSNEAEARAAEAERLLKEVVTKSRDAVQAANKRAEKAEDLRQEYKDERDTAQFNQATAENNRDAWRKSFENVANRLEPPSNQVRSGEPESDERDALANLEKIVKELDRLDQEAADVRETIGCDTEDDTAELLRRLQHMTETEDKITAITDQAATDAKNAAADLSAARADRDGALRVMWEAAGLDPETIPEAANEAAAAVRDAINRERDTWKEAADDAGKKATEAREGEAAARESRDKAETARDEAEAEAAELKEERDAFEQNAAEGVSLELIEAKAKTDRYKEERDRAAELLDATRRAAVKLKQERDTARAGERGADQVNGIAAKSLAKKMQTVNAIRAALPDASADALDGSGSLSQIRNILESEEV